MSGLRRRRTRVIAGIGAFGTAALAATFAVSVPASAAERAKSGDRAEAWYATTPVDTCGLPLGCPLTAVPTSPYPEHTLHVGVAAGVETARTYLVPDVSVVPSTATVTAATLSLPVVRDSDAGTVSPQSAAILACLTSQPVTDGTAGSSETPPAYDKRICVRPKYDAKGTGTFTVDLTKFLRAWASGTAMNGVVLVPDLSDATPTTVWHVTTNGRKRTHVPHVRTVFAYTTPPAPRPGSSPPPEPTPVAPPAPAGGAPPPFAAPPAVSSGNLPPVAQPTQAPQVAPAAPQQQAAVFVTAEFKYPAAFLLPLGFLVAAVFLVRTFTRDPLTGRARA